jgi:hypothetical protein
MSKMVLMAVSIPSMRADFASSTFGLKSERAHESVRVAVRKAFYSKPQNACSSMAQQVI